MHLVRKGRWKGMIGTVIHDNTKQADLVLGLSRTDKNMTDRLNNLGSNLKPAFLCSK